MSEMVWLHNLNFNTNNFSDETLPVAFAGVPRVVREQSHQVAPGGARDHSPVLRDI
jgi:hypothetical protein